MNKRGIVRSVNTSSSMYTVQLLYSVAERTVWTVWQKGQYGQAQFPEDSGLKGSGQQSTDTFATKEREVNTIEAFLKPTSQAVCNVYNF